MMVRDGLYRVTHGIVRGVLWLAREGVPAAALLVASGALMWVVFGFHAHMIPMTERGVFGSYGQIELKSLLGPGTEVLEFSAVRVPSRIAWRFVPVADEIEVTVRYRDRNFVEQSWCHTYVVACTKKGSCGSVNILRGIGLFGIDEAGELVERKWVYFREALPPHLYAVPCPTPPLSPGVPTLPSPKKPVLPSGVLLV